MISGTVTLITVTYPDLHYVMVQEICNECLSKNMNVREDLSYYHIIYKTSTSSGHEESSTSRP